MDKIHNLLLQDAKRLAALIFLIMLGQTYSMRAYLRELAELEYNLRAWLIRETRAFLQRPLLLAAPLRAKSTAVRRSITPRPTRSRICKGSPTLGFRIISIPSPRAAAQNAPAPLPPHHVWIHFKHQTILNRLEAARRVINDPAPVIAYLARKLAAEADDLVTAYISHHPYSEEMIKLANLEPDTTEPDAPWRPDS